MNNDIIEVAKSICNKFGVSFDDFKISNIDDINAILVSPKESLRGLGGFIIADDGSFLTCGSLHPLDYYIEKFKSGQRDTID